MGLIKFRIIPDHPVYYSGQIISGRLVVAVNKPMLMRAIYLKYSGKASVYWTETHRRNGENYTETYWNVEHYLSLQQMVFGSEVEDYELPEGQHVFRFQCQLPVNVPSSFEGLYGRIRYSIKATIDRPWKFNHVEKQPITVMSMFDLNHHVFATAPIAEQKSKTFWGHSGKPLFMSVNLPVRGYVPGQVIPIKVFLNNESGVQVNALYVTLKQNVTFHATRKSRSVRMFVFKNEFPVPEGFGCEEIPLNLQVPSLPPSYLEFSRIIDLNYQLNVKAIVNAWYHRNLKIGMEVIIGNIPVMNYQMPVPMSMPMPEPFEPVDPEDPSCNEVPKDAPPPYGFVMPVVTSYGDLPPPSYQQCMGLGRSENDVPEDAPDSDGEVKEYAPIYPVYKFETS